MRFVHTLRGFVRIGHRDQARLVATWSLLGFCRLLIVLAPFRLVRRLLGDRASRASEPLPAPPPLDERDRSRALHIGTLIGVAARNTPWRSECYPQALTARIMLGLCRIPHVVHFGVRRQGDSLQAHAWVHSGDIAVTGGTGSDYTTVGSFSWKPRTGKEE